MMTEATFLLGPARLPARQLFGRQTLKFLHDKDPHVRKMLCSAKLQHPRNRMLC
jgi:hypothetical protein